MVRTTLFGSAAGAGACACANKAGAAMRANRADGNFTFLWYRSTRKRCAASGRRVGRLKDGGHGTSGARKAPVAAVAVNLIPGKFGFGQLTGNQDGAAGGI